MKIITFSVLCICVNSQALKYGYFLKNGLCEIIVTLPANKTVMTFQPILCK